MKRRLQIQTLPEAGSNQEAEEDDRDAEGPEVAAGPHGMFLFPVYYYTFQYSNIICHVTV